MIRENRDIKGVNGSEGKGWSIKSVKVSKKTHKILGQVGRKEESYDEIIFRILKENEAYKTENRKLKKELETIKKRLNP